MDNAAHQQALERIAKELNLEANEIKPVTAEDPVFAQELKEPTQPARNFLQGFLSRLRKKSLV